MPDSYGICLTLVNLLGARTALPIIMPAPIAMATISIKKTGVNSAPIGWLSCKHQPGRATFVKGFTKSAKKNPRLAPGIVSSILLRLA